MVSRIWRGRYSLAVTFWGFFIFGFLALTIIFAGLLWPVFVSVPYWWFVAALQLLFGIVVGVGVWRSADSYSGPTPWAIAAKAAVCLWLGWALYQLAATAPISD